MVSTPNNKKQCRLTTEYLIQQLNQLAEQYKIKTWCLAYSGGVDSQVLLHLLYLSKLNVKAIYIDHGLQRQSADWANHCFQQCEQLGITFQIIKVDASAQRGESPEAAARSARYAALKKCIQNNDCLLTAQHQDDQTETILLQLLRGAGAAGLSGMPEIARFGSGWHARPLLSISQKQITDYAELNNLSWVEDPSNQQVNYDRNYLRHSVMPQLKQRWPSLNKTLSVFASQQAENAQLLNVLAESDLNLSMIDESRLDINQLTKLDDARLRNALRYWLKFINKPMPSRAVLEQVVLQIKNNSHDSAVLVSWANVEIRCFRNELFCLQKLSHDAAQVFNWDLQDDLHLSSIEKKLRVKKTNTNNEQFVLDASLLKLPVTVRYRQGGERIKPAGRNATHDLKSLFQESAVPAWQRDRIPLIYIGDELVAVVGYWLEHSYAVKGEGILLELHAQ
ncbi:MAG: tRNA lysidine(34) synthetase TilS [Gammaproteobacteria bacterium]|nr:tRNA lysidine(34) synthetase TilS [Gammaproteobacteria bacterium]